MYKIYLDYLKIFEENYKSREEIDENNKILFSQCKTKIYFLKLICITSLFWFIYSVIYIDWNAFDAKNLFDYFLHAIQRLSILETAYQVMESKTFL